MASGSTRATVGTWAALGAGSLLLWLLLHWIGVPAAALLGPMFAAIAVALLLGRIALPSVAGKMPQPIIGCLIANNVTPEVYESFLAHAPLFLTVVVATIAVATLIGWWMSVRQILPGATALWGISPGAASAMVAVAHSSGVDARLVGLGQYSRLAIVAVIAAALAHFTLPDAPAPSSALIALEPVDWPRLALTLLFAAAAGVIGWWLRFPSATVLIPALAGGILNALGLISFELPAWLLLLAFTLLGWTVGLRFDRKVIREAVAVLPAILLANAALVAFCGAVALLLHLLIDVDLLSAYLATSPGGLDVALVIAATTHGDITFVMGLQMVRVVCVLLLVPPLAAHLSSKATATPPD